MLETPHLVQVQLLALVLSLVDARRWLFPVVLATLTLSFAQLVGLASASSLLRYEVAFELNFDENCSGDAHWE